MISVWEGSFFPACNGSFLNLCTQKTASNWWVLYNFHLYSIFFLIFSPNLLSFFWTFSMCLFQIVQDWWAWMRSSIVRLSGLESWFHHLFTVWLWTNCLFSLNLCFLISKMDMIIILPPRAVLRIRWEKYII